MDAMCYSEWRDLCLSSQATRRRVRHWDPLAGFSIYEAMTTYNRKPFMMADHMARFRASTKRLIAHDPGWLMNK